MNAVRPVGDLLRDWRQRRRLSQLALACEADISARHLSFVETGRAQPSRDMILHLAERLDVPPRERNLLLLAAGFAPLYPARSLADPALGAARDAIRIILERQKPYPAFAVDRHWRQFPGYVIRLVSGIEAHNGHVRFSWAAGGTTEAPFYLGGTDFAALGPDGRFASVVGFTDAAPAAVG